MKTLTFKEYLMEEYKIITKIGHVPYIYVDKEDALFNNISKLEKLGQGASAVAYIHNDPTKIIKIEKRAEPNSAQIAMANLFLDHQDNPHFPKVYSAKLYRTIDRRKTFIMIMEKLYPITSSKLQDIFIHLLKQAGIHNKKFEKEFNKNPNSGTAAYLFSNIMEIYKGSDKFPKFKEAMDLVTQEHGYTFDLHTDNIMIRLTGHGPQLVIVDPLS